MNQDAQAESIILAPIAKPGRLPLSQYPMERDVRFSTDLCQAPTKVRTDQVALVAFLFQKVFPFRWNVGSVHGDSLAADVMREEEVFLVHECWLAAGSLEAFKEYRKKTIEILLQHGAEYAYHGHPFAWEANPGNEDVPTGIEVLRFENEAKARAALALLRAPELEAEGRKVLCKVRSYLSKYAVSPAQMERLTR
jgi:hypothetical protein